MKVFGRFGSTFMNYSLSVTSNLIIQRCTDFLAWNIMSIQQIKIIAAEVPTTTKELFQCGLPENIVKDYGERLLKNINTYNKSNDLRSYLDDRPKKKLKLNHTAVNHHTNHQQH